MHTYITHDCEYHSNYLQTHKLLYVQTKIQYEIELKAICLTSCNGLHPMSFKKKALHQSLWLVSVHSDVH